LTHSFLFHIA
jgi:hypothetical protein